MAAKKPFPEIESVALAVGLVVLGAVMLLWPHAVDGATVGGRHSAIKAVMVAVWGAKGGIGCLAVGGMYLGWLFRPWRPASPPEESASPA